MVVQHVFMFHWNMKTRCEHQLVFLRAIVVAVATCSHERSAIESRMRRCNAHGDARCLSTASSPRAAGIATSHPQKGEISLITLASLIAPNRALQHIDTFVGLVLVPANEKRPYLGTVLFIILG